MDDAASLAAELLRKLSELELKVEHHRQDMAAEFHRYSHQLLQNVSDDVSARVEKVIRDSMHHYPALNPALNREHPLLGQRRPDEESPSTGSSSASNSNSGSDTDDRADRSGIHPRRWRGSASPPPVLPHRSGQPPDHSPRSPHEREREFQGLFTPSYLPLLDGRDGNLTSPPSLLPPPPSLPTALLPLSPAQSRELTKDPAKAEQSTLSPTTAAAALRPEPIRHPTNDTLSSCASDDSASKSRRSALRCSSSSSAKAHSPRRVRFEVEGGEVLPTASPPLSPRAAGHTLSPLAANPSSFVASPSYDSSAINEVDEEEDGLLGSSPPLPKKVTSTDRLKAMARNSTEDTSKWTVVGDLQDLDEEEEALIMGSRKKPGARVPAATPDVNTGRDQPASPPATGDVQHIEDVMEQDEEQDDDADLEDDEDLLEMPALSSFKGRKKFSPPDLTIPSSNHDTTSPEPTPTIANSSQTAGAKVESRPTAGSSSDTRLDDDEDFFGYEPDEAADDAATAQKNKGENKPPPKYIQAEDEADEEDDLFDEESLPTPKARDFSYSTSPGISIVKPSTASSSLPSRHVNPAVGSYNGKPFTLPSVKNPEILEEAAKMGNVYTFVGSVDGRSGVDESTAYRPDTTMFSGTPKSLSERLLMEEFGESRKLPPKNAGGK